LRLLRDLEVVPLDLPQDHLLDPVEVDEVVVEGGPYTLDEGIGRVVSEEAMEAPDGAEGLSSVALLQAVDEAPEHLVLSAQVLLFRAGRAWSGLATPDSMQGVGDTRLGS
jgi:hypothetical protein